MTVRFDKAIVQTEGNEVFLALRLPVESRQEARRFSLDMKPGKIYTADLKLHRDRRSKDANAMYWEMCGRLARELGMTPEELYRRHIRDMAVYDVLCIKTDNLDAFTRRWCSDHLGRRVETRDSKLPGCTTVLAYYGSSDFNRAEMSRLIDSCIEDCKACGIDTTTEQERSLLLEEWGNAPRD